MLHYLIREFSFLSSITALLLYELARNQNVVDKAGIQNSFIQICFRNIVVLQNRRNSTKYGKVAVSAGSAFWVVFQADWSLMGCGYSLIMR